MAGIGATLNRFFSKRSLTAYLAGFVYSTVITVAPMVLVMGDIMLMSKFLGYDRLSYSTRSLFSCTVLYIFIFSQLLSSPFNAVLSRCMSDVIYEERYEDIMPCFYTGLLISMGVSSAVAIPFVVREWAVGGVAPGFCLLSLLCFLALQFVSYVMLYLSICKDYGKITGFYLLGMLAALGLAAVLVLIFGVEVISGMLAGLFGGFLLTACLELGQLKSYFRKNSRNYRKVLPYFRKYWPLVVSNFLYTAGLYAHNFVFWTTDMRMVVAKSFVCAEPYDMATYLALLTNITSSVIFISNVEMHFHEKYKNYSESVIGGRLVDIERSKAQMFRQLSMELMSLTRIQFIISAALFLIFTVVMPMLGFSGTVMQIYPCLAAGYFVLFIMYGELIFLYYYNDLLGAVMTAGVFFSITVAGSFVTTHLLPIWYGAGLFVGGIVSWTVGYGRLRWVERNLDRHIFCNGTLLKRGRGEKPSSRVYVKRG